MAINKTTFGMMHRYELQEADKPKAVELLLGIMLEYGDAPFTVDYTDCVASDGYKPRFYALDMLHRAGLLAYHHDAREDKLHFKISEKGLDLCR